MTNYDNIDISLCYASEDQISYAFFGALKHAHKIGKLIYIYERMGLFVMTHTYYEDRRVIAKVYPDGRSELFGL